MTCASSSRYNYLLFQLKETEDTTVHSQEPRREIDGKGNKMSSANDNLENDRSINDQQLAISCSSRDSRSGDNTDGMEMVLSEAGNEDPGLASLLIVVGGSENYNALMDCVQKFTNTDTMITELRAKWTNNDTVDETIKYLRKCPYFFTSFLKSIPSHHYGIGGELLCKLWAAEKFKKKRPRVDLDKLL